MVVLFFLSWIISVQNTDNADKQPACFFFDFFGELVPIFLKTGDE